MHREAGWLLAGTILALFEQVESSFEQVAQREGSICLSRNDSVGIGVHLLGLFAMRFVAQHLRISS